MDSLIVRTQPAQDLSSFLFLPKGFYFWPSASESYRWVDTPSSTSGLGDLFFCCIWARGAGPIDWDKKWAIQHIQEVSCLELSKPWSSQLVLLRATVLKDKEDAQGSGLSQIRRSARVGRGRRLQQSSHPGRISPSVLLPEGVWRVSWQRGFRRLGLGLHWMTRPHVATSLRPYITNSEFLAFFHSVESTARSYGGFGPSSYLLELSPGFLRRSDNKTGT